MHKPTRLFGILGIALAMAACGSSGSAAPDGAIPSDASGGGSCEAPYVPFSPANYENQRLRIGAYDQIVAIRKAEGFAAEDFAEIQSLYEDTASLRDKVTGRSDDHDYGEEEVGAALDTEIMTAIGAGSAGEDIAVQGQIVDKVLQRFFYLSVYHEMMKSQDGDRSAEDIEKGWDEAFGYFGLDNDGRSPTGIAKTLQKRDEELGFNLTAQVYNGLIEGRCMVAEGDYSGVVATIEEVDMAMLRGFALSVVHEMDEYAENPLIKGWEGLLYWNIVADYVRTIDSASFEAVESEFAKGVESIDPAVVRSAVVGAFGFEL